MEEDQEETTEDAVTEDDLMEEVLEEGASEGKKSMRIGKSFITHAKNFMDAEWHIYRHIIAAPSTIITQHPLP